MSDDIKMETKKKSKRDENTTQSPEQDAPSAPTFTSDDHEIDVNNLFQGLDKPMTFDELLIAPNAATLEDVVNIANNGKDASASRSTFGHLIEPGKFGIIDHNGKVQLIGPGRWILPNPRATLQQIASFEDNVIRYETLTIVRISRGEVGLATDNGQPLLLGEGVHVRNQRLFAFVESKNVNQQYLQHGSLHIMRVPKGYYGLVTDNNIPKLLPEGTHVTNANVFKFDGVQLINTPYITHGTFHILRIPKGQVAKVIDNNKPKLLEGTHCINSKTFSYHDMESLSQTIIIFNTITRFIIRKGEVGCAWDNNSPVFYEEGVYVKDSPLFKFERCVPTSDKVITLGAKKIVTVWDGEVGVSYLRGKLVVLKPDRHLIDSTEHTFQGFLSTQQQCLHLEHKKDEPKKKGEPEGMLICETKDFVEIGIRSDVFYKICDAALALLVVGKDNIETLVRETAIACLNSIIRSTSLAEIAQNKEINAKSTKEEEKKGGTAFFDKVHDEFISKLHDTFIEHYGIEVTNIRIESFRIMNSDLATNISTQAFVTAQTETQLANLTGQTEIATAQQRRDAEVARIKAEGEAVKLKTEIDAKNRAVLESARAEADAQVIRAKAEAQAIEVRATAEAKSILLKAEAESKRAELLNSTLLGGQIQMYQMYTDMVKSSMNGVEKVIYMPTDGVNPMNFFAFQQGVIPGVVATPQQNTGRRNQ